MQTLTHPRIDRYLIALVLSMAVSFLLINFNDTKWTLPVLVWAVMGAVAAPLLQRIPCLLLLISWAFFWAIAFSPFLRGKRFMLPICTSLPWVVVVWQATIYVSRPFSEANLWFWLPASVFLLSSVLAIYRSLSSPSQ